MKKEGRPEGREAGHLSTRITPGAHGEALSVVRQKSTLTRQTRAAPPVLVLVRGATAILACEPAG